MIEESSSTYTVVVSTGLPMLALEMKVSRYFHKVKDYIFASKLPIRKEKGWCHEILFAQGSKLFLMPRHLLK